MQEFRIQNKQINKSIPLSQEERYIQDQDEEDPPFYSKPTYFSSRPPIRTYASEKSKKMTEKQIQKVGRKMVSLLMFLIFLGCIVALWRMQTSLNENVSLQKKIKNHHHLKNPESVTAILINFDKQQYLKHSLNTFIKHKNYALDRIVCIVKQIPSRQMIKNYKNVMWIYNQEENQNIKYAQLDKIIKNYKSQYYFIFDDQWLFVEDDFIVDSINALSKFQSVSQLILYAPNAKAVGEKSQGFSFTPGLHRRKDLIKIQGGFSRLVNRFYEDSVGVEKRLNDLFLNQNLYALKSKKNYVKPMYNSNRFKIPDILQQSVKSTLEQQMKRRQNN